MVPATEPSSSSQQGLGPHTPAGSCCWPQGWEVKLSLSPPTGLARARPALLSQPAGPSLANTHPSPNTPPPGLPQASEQQLWPAGRPGAAGPSRQGEPAGRQGPARPGYRGRLSAGLEPAAGAPPWPSQHRPLSPAPPGLPGSALGLGAASFPATQWFLPMAPAQSDDSGQLHRQGRAPSSRQTRYHGDWSPPQPETGRRTGKWDRSLPWAALGSSPPTPLASTEQTRGGRRVLKQPVVAFNGLWVGGGKQGAGATAWLGAHGPQPQSISGSSASVSAAQRSSRAASEPGQKRMGWRRPPVLGTRDGLPPLPTPPPHSQ